MGRVPDPDMELAGTDDRIPDRALRRLWSKRAGFEEFAAAHGDGLVKLAFAIGGDRHRAEDAGQEALARVYQRWSRLDAPLAYARRTVINAAYDDRRRVVREDRAMQEAGRQPTPALPHPQDRLNDRGLLMAALDDLPPRQRAVIVLRYGSGLSEAQTAATLEISIGTVKSQTARALARMREALASEPVTNLETA
jgi:RNA polymerase sigma-70 factor (sigma-E family)